MRTNLIKLVSITLFIFSSTAISGKYNAVLEIGDSMPGFTDLPSISGKTLSSKDIKDSVLVLVSLANHCPWVRGLDGDLINMVDQVKDLDVKVIAFSVNHREDDRLPAMQKHAKKTGYNFDYVYDESQALGRALGATRTPEYFVFNKDRKLVYMGLLHDSPARMRGDGSVKYINGKPKQFYVRDAIDSTLNKTEVKVAETRAHGCTVKYAN